MGKKSCQIPNIPNRLRPTLRKAVTLLVVNKLVDEEFTSDRVYSFLQPYGIQAKAVHSVIDKLRGEGQLEVTGKRLVKSTTAGGNSKARSLMNHYVTTDLIREQYALYVDAHKTKTPIRVRMVK